MFDIDEIREVLTQTTNRLCDIQSSLIEQSLHDLVDELGEAIEDLRGQEYLLGRTQQSDANLKRNEIALAISTKAMEAFLSKAGPNVKPDSSFVEESIQKSLGIGFSFAEEFQKAAEVDE